ncbi:MAG: DHA2 family efflux MFS transporter permease subunit [Xanthobacteraceae bacterium]|nr:DHA2 family efflux MFS transporter permease subunit [Xanthobacteraceae bacterium]
MPSRETHSGTKTWALVLTSAASFMMVLDAIVVVTALGAIRTDLRASVEALEWILNAYNLSFAVLLLTGAALGDRLGRRRMFVAGLVLFVAASIACALAPDSAWLIGARALQGAGAALVMPLAMALLSAAFPPQERGKALGLFSSLTGLALILGPVVGGAIAQGLAWQWIFWVNVPIALVVIPLARQRLDESFGPDAAIDVPGVVLVTGAAFGLVYGIICGNAAGWTSSVVTTTLGIGFLFGALFIGWELRIRDPMVPMRFFRQRAFTFASVATFLFNSAMYGVLFLLPQFFQVAQGHGLLDAGLRLLPWTATLFLVAPLSGALINRLGERMLIGVGLALQAASLAWISVIATPDVAYSKLILPLILTGSGVSLAMPAAQNAILSSVAKPEIGKAAGIYNMIRFLGGVCGIAVAGAVFVVHGSLASPQAFAAGFIAAMQVAAALSLLGALAGACVSRLGLSAPAPARTA